MAIEEQAQLATRLHEWLVHELDQGVDGADLLGAVALVLGDMLGHQSVNGAALDAEALLIVLEQRFVTVEAEEAMPEEGEGFELEEEEEEDDHVEGEEKEGTDEGFGV